jgi:phosphate:Na+ symporter
LIGVLGRYLEKKFANTDDETLFIHKVKVTDNDAALVALEKEVEHLLLATAHITVTAFDHKLPPEIDKELKKEFTEKKFHEQYEYIKQLNGEIHDFSSRFLQHNNDQDILSRLEQLTDATRNTMYAAKNIKDTFVDIEQLKKSSNDRKYTYFKDTGTRISGFFADILRIVRSPADRNEFDALRNLYKGIQENYKQLLQDLHKEDLRKSLSELEFSTILNFNREISTCEKSVLFAVKDLVLKEEQAVKFDDLPGFIR